MAITVNGILAYERWESFRKGRNADGPFVDLQYLVAFANADNFVDSVMGGISRAGGTVHNVPKLRCPTNPTLFAMAADYVGAAETNVTSGGRPEFVDALVTVHFEVPTWPQFPADDPGGDQSFPNDLAPGSPIIFAECEIDYGGEMVTIPNTSLVFISDGKKLEAPVAKWVGVQTWRVVRHYYPNLPHAKLTSLMNRINNTTFMGQDRGKVRLHSAKTRQTKTSDGTRVQNFEFELHVREYDWNEFIREDDMLFDLVGSPLDSTKQPYKYDDLTPLIS
jgi:hypothetical protein